MVDTVVHPSIPLGILVWAEFAPSNRGRPLPRRAPNWPVSDNRIWFYHIRERLWIPAALRIALT